MSTRGAPGPALKAVLALLGCLAACGCSRSSGSSDPGSDSDQRIELIGQENMPVGKASLQADFLRVDAAAVVSFKANKDSSSGVGPSSVVDFGGGRTVNCPAYEIPGGRFKVYIPRGYASPPKTVTLWTIPPPTYVKGWTPPAGLEAPPLAMYPGRPSGPAPFRAFERTTPVKWTLKTLPEAYRCLDRPKKSPLLKAHHVLFKGDPAISFDWIPSVPSGWSRTIQPDRFTFMPDSGSAGWMMNDHVFFSVFAPDQDAAQCTVFLSRPEQWSGRFQIQGCRVVARLGVPYLEIPHDQRIAVGPTVSIFIPAQRDKIYPYARGSSKAVRVTMVWSHPPDGINAGSSVDYAGANLSKYGLNRIDLWTHDGKPFAATKQSWLQYGPLPPLEFAYKANITRKVQVFKGSVPIE